MKIAVCVKHVPCGTLRMRPDSSALDRAGPGELNASDKNAIEEALRLKEGRDAEIVLVTMGPTAATESLRTGLGMGADRAVLVDDQAVAGSDLVATSRVLASVLQRESVDLVLFGQQTSDGGGAVLWAAVAERLELPFVSQANKLTLGTSTVIVERETEVGNDTVEATLPAVVAVSDAINEPRYTSLKGMMAAKKKPLETVTASDLGVPADKVGADGSQTVVLSLGTPPARPGAVTIEDDGSAAQSIFDYLTERELHMSMLVFLEHHEGAVSPGSLGLLTKAAALDADVAAVLVGDDQLGPLATEAGHHGAATVFTVVDAFPSPLPGPRIDVIAELVRTRGYDTVLLSNSVLAADVAAGLAARLDAGINWDLVDLELRDGQPVGRQPMLQDSLLAEVGWRSAPRVALFRPGSFEAVRGASMHEPAVESLVVAFTEHTMAARVTGRSLRADEGPSLADADVIVAGGLGLGSPEGFELAEQLAAALGGVVGATRAAVYKDWYPPSSQIGQTGKTVAPKLYVALGISGAVQHKVGMQNSKTIISVNKDPNAPIFEFSDLAIVGDVHTVVPVLVELLRKHPG